MTNENQKHKKNLRKEACEYTKIFLKKKKKKMCLYPRDCNKIHSKVQKQKPVEYMKIYYLAHKK